MKWEYYAGRRRISLQEFLKEAKTLKDAVALFNKLHLTLPEGDQLKTLYAEAPKKVPAPVPQEDPAVKKHSTPTPIHSGRPVTNAKKPSKRGS